MSQDIFIAVEQAMSKDEKDTFLRGFLRQNPRWQGAHVADILAELDNRDANLDVVERMHQEHGDDVATPGLLAAAVRVAYWSIIDDALLRSEQPDAVLLEAAGAELDWERVRHLIARVEK